MNGAKRLSRLQKQILVLALENKQRECRGYDADSGADVYYSEILAEVFRFPVRNALSPRKRPCSRIFAPAQIGRRRYRNAIEATSRAVLRLHIRGAVKSAHSKHSTWAGASLTPLGVAIAKQLSQTVNSD
jgi:hypothetical protein